MQLSILVKEGNLEDDAKSFIAIRCVVEVADSVVGMIVSIPAILQFKSLHVDEIV